MSVGRSSSPTEATSNSGDAKLMMTNDSSDKSKTTTTTAAATDGGGTMPTSKADNNSKQRTTRLVWMSSSALSLLLFIGWYYYHGGGEASTTTAAVLPLWLSKFGQHSTLESNDDDNNNNIAQTQEKEEEEDQNEQTKEVQEVVQSTIKKYKNVARGLEGTVVKSMNRGYPLATYLEEDLTMYGESSDDDDDDEESGDDDEESRDDYEFGGKKEVILEEHKEHDEEGELSLGDHHHGQHRSSVSSNAQQQLNTNNNKPTKLDSSSEEEEEEDDFYDATAASKKAQQVALQIASSPNSTTADIERATNVAKEVMELMKSKKDVGQHARLWEGGEEAVIQIVLMEEKENSDDDEEEMMDELTISSTEVTKEKMKDDTESSSGDDDDDSDDSNDDEEEQDSSDDHEEENSSEEPKSKKKTSSTKTTKASSSSNKSSTTSSSNELHVPNLSNLSPEDAASTILNGISSNLQERMSTMFTKAKTHECRAKIGQHFALFINGLATESKFPFQDWYYPSTCTAIPYYENWDNLPPEVNAHELHHRVYQPPKDSVPEGTYIDKVEDLELVYVILTHDQPEATIRLIESVYVKKRTKFVVHVDGKEGADETFDRLVEYAQEKNDGEGEEYIRLVPNANRVRVNWGGFSMVNATLVAMKTLFGLDHYAEHSEEQEEEDVPIVEHDNPHAFSFHKMIHLASTTYPLASNTEIRDTLASYPLDANFMHILLQPNDPTPQVWNYFVECDDALHRIYRLPPLTIDKGHGIDIHTSSQWFIISREFAWYLANPPKNSLVDYLRDYMEHVVVADESFFGTILRNTHFCSTLHNDNFLHIQFGSWENESKSKSERDPRKCVMRNPDHCGRSPTTMTLDYLPVLELSGDLFARKFDDVAEPLVKDYIDRRRAKEEERFLREEALAKEIEANKTAGVEVTEKLPLESWEFQGEGVMLVAKETVLDKVPLCLGLSKDGANRVHLLPCFKEDVPPTLSPDWYTGAVIIEEIENFNRWDIGPCSSDGALHRNETTGGLEMTPGEYSQTGPKCMLKIGDSIRKGRCLDVESDRTKPGAYANIFPCEAKWNQLFSFGNGDAAPSGGVHVTLPSSSSRKSTSDYLCLGVQGRSAMDKEEWIRHEDDDDPDELWPWERDNAIEYSDNGFKSLKYWDGIHLQTTPCSNEGAVIEFLYVPFIVEEYENDKGESTDNEKSDATAVEDEKKTGDAEKTVVDGGDEL
ncbi:hypothetical protein ACHAWT_003862 [Skeletonema menzelii]